MTRIQLGLFFIIGTLFLFLVSLPIYSGDVKNHLVWGQSIIEKGSLGFYGREFYNYAFPNYPPLAMGLFALSYKLYRIFLSVIYFLNTFPIFPSNLVYFFEWENVLISFLKLPAILSTVGLSYLIYLVVKKENINKYLASSILIINPSIIYLSAIWGQIDVLPTFFVVWSFYLLFKNRLIISVVLIALALLTKQTVLIFWGIYMLTIFKLKGLRWLIKGVATSLVIFYLAYLPFHSPSLTWPLELYKLNFSLVAFSTSENAINLWGALYNFKRSDDTAKFLILSLQQWGYLLFGLSFLPLIYFFIKRKITLYLLILFSAITSLNYYFFLTRMHERYLAPAVIFLTILVFLKKKHSFALIYFSALYFLNLYRGLLLPDNNILITLSRNKYLLDFLVLGYAFFIVYYYYLFIKPENE